MTRRPHERTHQHALALLLAAGNPSIHGEAPSVACERRTRRQRMSRSPNPNNGVYTPNRRA